MTPDWLLPRFRCGVSCPNVCTTNTRVSHQVNYVTEYSYLYQQHVPFAVCTSTLFRVRQLLSRVALWSSRSVMAPGIIWSINLDVVSETAVGGEYDVGSPCTPAVPSRGPAEGWPAHQMCAKDRGTFGKSSRVAAMPAVTVCCGTRPPTRSRHQ